MSDNINSSAILNNLYKYILVYPPSLIIIYSIIIGINKCPIDLPPFLNELFATLTNNSTNTTNVQKLKSTYGKAKLMATNYLLKLNKKSNFPCTILRLYLIYGTHQDTNRLIPYTLNKCLNNENFSCSEGKQYRDFLFVEDLIKAIVNCFDNKKSIKHIVFNIARKLLILGGLGALIVKVKTLMAISDKKFLNFNNKEMILNNVDGEFLRIIHASSIKKRQNKKRIHCREVVYPENKRRVS